MRIAVCWTFDKAKTIFDDWRDGVKASFEIIALKHRVDWILGDDCWTADLDKYDAVVQWDNSTNAYTKYLSKFSNPRKCLILTTELGLSIDNLRNYDVVYCEATPVQNAIKPHGLRTLLAFGTDTEFFKPDDTVKDIKYLCVGTFSPWKQQRKLAHLGKDLYCVGSLQPDGREDYQAVVDAGATVELGYFPVSHIRDLYRRAEHVVIPGYEGSGRTVIEALSMGLPVEVSLDNHKCQSYLKEFKASGMEPREFAVAHYSAQGYADSLMKGIDG